MRNGVTKLPVPNTASPDTIRAMPVEMFLDYLGVRLDPEKAGDEKVAFNLSLTDTNKKWTFGVENGALHHSHVRHATNSNTTITITRSDLNDIMLGQKTLQQQIVAGIASCV